MSDETEILSYVAESIRRWRKRAGLTMNQLAEMAGIDTGFLACIETGKKMPSLMTVGRIARALDVSLGQLFDRSPKPNRDSDYEVVVQLRSLFHGCNPSHRAELIVLLKQLRDRRSVRALRYIMRR